MPLTWSDRTRTRTQDIQNAIEVAYGVGALVTTYPGVVADTGVDVGPAIEAAIDAAPDGTLRFTAGVYKCSAMTTSRSNLTIELMPGAVLEGITSGAAVLTVTGVRSATTTNLTANCVEHQQDGVAVANTAGFTVGDWVLLEDEQVDVDSGSYADSEHHSEINRIAEITDSTHFKLKYPAADTYSTSVAARIKKLTPAENVRITGGGKVTNTGYSASSPLGGHGIKFALAVNCGSDNILYEDVRNQGLKFEETLACYAVRNTFRDAPWFAGNGYGVTTTSCLETLIDHNHATRLRHAYDISYFSRDTLVSNNTAKSCAYSAFQTHPHVKRTVFSDNIIANVRGYDDATGRIMADGTNQGHGYSIREYNSEILISGGMVSDVNLAGACVGAEACSNITIKNVVFKRCNLRGLATGVIFLDNQSNVTPFNSCPGLVVTDNVIEDCYGNGIVNTFNDAIIERNVIRGMKPGNDVTNTFASGSATAECIGILIAGRNYSAVNPGYSSISGVKVKYNTIETGCTYGIVFGSQFLYTAVPTGHSLFVLSSECRGNSVTGTQKSGIMAVPVQYTSGGTASLYLSAINIAENQITGCNTTSAAGHGGILAADANNVYSTAFVPVTGNRVDACAIAGIFGGFTNQPFVRNRVINTTGANCCGIYYKSWAAGQNLTGPVFEDNYVDGTAVFDGLRINESATVGTVSQITIKGGIYSNNGRYGIRVMDFCDRTLTQGTTCFNNITAGLRIEGDNHTSVNDVSYDTRSTPVQPYGIDIAAAASGTVLHNPKAFNNLSGNIRDGGSGTVCHPAVLKVPNAASFTTYTMPSADGTSGQVLSTNGSATLSWATASQAFPVGSIYLAVVSTNPNTLLGYGTWSSIGAGRVLVGLDSGDVDFDTVEETGGAKTVASAGTVAAPTISGSTANESAHTHSVTTNVTVGNHTTGAVEAFASSSATVVTGNTHSVTNNAVTSAAGSAHGHAAGTLAASAPSFTGTPTSVVQPYLVCYMWKRTA